MKRKLLAITLTLVFFLSACGVRFLTLLQDTFSLVPAATAGFVVAHHMTQEEANKLDHDADTFSQDAQAIASAPNKALKVVAVKKLADDFLHAEKDFHLPDVAANAKFSKVYKIASGIVARIESYYGVSNQSRTAKRAVRPSEAEIKDRIQELRNELQR